MRLPKLGAVARPFLRDPSGAIGLWMAVAILPITLLVGAASDLRRVETMRGALQEASDAAVLAAARAYLAAGIDDPGRLSKAQAAAGASLSGNLGGMAGRLRNLEWTVSNPAATGELVLTTRARSDLAFGGLFGVSDLPVKTSAASMVDIRLEVALVLDTTGSMNSNGKLQLLKDSTTSLIGQLETAAVQSGRANALRVALVPYSNTVRLPGSYQGRDWWDPTSSGSDYRAPDNRNRFAGYGTSGWGGCLESRPYPHDVRDTQPSRSDLNTLFVPWFNTRQPDTPTDPATNPNEGCGLSESMPLTADTGAVRASVRTMVADGYTNIPMGLMWGWHALTPSGGPFGAGAAEPYLTPDLVKAVVLVTDGQNDLGHPSEGDNYLGVGLLSQNRVGVTQTSSNEARREALDERLTELCRNMKERGIILYTVRVEVDTGPDAVLKGCAHKPEAPFYHDVRDARDLGRVFSRIGQDLVDVRLSR